MKKNIHPKIRPVLFRDSSNGASYIALSTVETKEKAEYENKEYPLCEVEISSASHPFYTGTQQLVDTAGRVERFNRRYNVNARNQSGASKHKAADKKKAHAGGKKDVDKTDADGSAKNKD